MTPPALVATATTSTQAVTREELWRAAVRFETRAQKAEARLQGCEEKMARAKEPLVLPPQPEPSRPPMTGILVWTAVVLAGFAIVGWVHR